MMHEDAPQVEGNKENDPNTLVKPHEEPAKDQPDPSLAAGEGAGLAATTYIAAPEVEQVDEWLTEGHEWIGKRIVRVFPHALPSECKVTKWVPADGEDFALWHIVHNDGDEEDLEEYEMLDSLKLATMNQAELREKSAAIDEADLAEKKEKLNAADYAKFVKNVEKIKAARAKRALKEKKDTEKAKLKAKLAAEKAEKKAILMSEKAEKKQKADAAKQLAKAKKAAEKAEKKQVDKEKEANSAERTLQKKIREVCKAQVVELEKLKKEEKKVEKKRAVRLSRDAKLQGKIAIEDSLVVRRGSVGTGSSATGADAGTRAGAGASEDSERQQDPRLARPLPYGEMAAFGLPRQYAEFAGRIISLWDFLFSFSGPVLGGRREAPRHFLPLTAFDLQDLLLALVDAGSRPVKLLTEVCVSLLSLLLRDLEGGGSLWGDLKAGQDQKQVGAEEGDESQMQTEDGTAKREKQGGGVGDVGGSEVTEFGFLEARFLLHPPHRSMLTCGTWQSVLLCLVAGHPSFVADMLGSPPSSSSGDMGSGTGTGTDLDLCGLAQAAVRALQHCSAQELPLPQKVALLSMLVEGVQRTEGMKEFLEQRTSERENIVAAQRQKDAERKRQEAKEKEEKAKTKGKGKGKKPPPSSSPEAKRKRQADEEEKEGGGGKEGKREGEQTLLPLVHVPTVEQLLPLTSIAPPPEEAAIKKQEAAARCNLTAKQSALEDAQGKKLSRLASQRLRRDVEQAQQQLAEVLSERSRHGDEGRALLARRAQLQAHRAHALKAIAAASRANDLEGLHMAVEMAEAAKLCGEGTRKRKAKKEKKEKKEEEKDDDKGWEKDGKGGEESQKEAKKQKKGKKEEQKEEKKENEEQNQQNEEKEPEQEEEYAVRWTAPELTAARRLLPVLARRYERERKDAELRSAVEFVRVRTECLGSDRDHHCYWKFVGDEGKLWVQELAVRWSATQPPSFETPATWRYYSNVEDVVALIAYLDERGVRERALKHTLQSRFLEITNGMHRLEVVVGSKGSKDSHAKEGAHAMEVDDSEKDEWRKEGHEWLGRRGRRLFEGGLRSDGRITMWVPASAEDPALWHFVHDDGDEEDLEEDEVDKALKDLEEGVEEATKVGEKGEGEEDEATVGVYHYKNRWKEPDLQDPSQDGTPGSLEDSLRSNLLALDACSVALLRERGCEWALRASRGSPRKSGGDDGGDWNGSGVRVKAEEGSGGRGEVLAMAKPGGRADWLAMVKSGGPVDLAKCLLQLETAMHEVQESDDVQPQDLAWQTEGHEWIGRRVRKCYKDPDADVVDEEKGGEGWITIDGTITKYLPATATDPMALWHFVHEDGDEEDLEKHEVEAGLEMAGDWQAQGHEWIGRKARKVFGMTGCSDGVITAWLEGDGEDPPLWHFVMNDGDEEDLEEYEVQEVLRNSRIWQLKHIGKNVAVQQEVSSDKGKAKSKGGKTKTKANPKKRQKLGPVLGTICRFEKGGGSDGAGLWYWVREESMGKRDPLEEVEGLSHEALLEAMRQAKQVQEEREAQKDGETETDEENIDDLADEVSYSDRLWRDWTAWQRWKWFVYDAGKVAFEKQIKSRLEAEAESSDGEGVAGGRAHNGGGGDADAIQAHISSLNLALLALRDHSIAFGTSDDDGRFPAPVATADMNNRSRANRRRASSKKRLDPQRQTQRWYGAKPKGKGKGKGKSGSSGLAAGRHA